MKKTACIFGSTGLIGLYLLDLLVKDERYEKIIVFNRKHVPGLNSKIVEIVSDYADLVNQKDNFKADDYFCCLGTTMAKAKSKEAFEYVDYQLPFDIAQIALEQNIHSLSIVSSIGASSKSGNFYLKTKGRMEEAVKGLGLKNLYIFRPSMLLGNRREFRLMESISKPFFFVIGYLLHGPLRKYRAIHGKTVAKAIINCCNSLEGMRVFESDQIQKMAY